MKTKTIALFTCMLLLSLLVASKTIAQQPKPARPVNPAQEQMTNMPASGNYTYKLFVAPNKVYGYDIFRDGKIVFHQPALQEPAGDKQAALTKKPQADRAATMAIEKIKKGIPAELTRQELMQITGH